MKELPKNPLLTVAEIQLSYQPSIKPSQRPKVTSADEAYSIFIQYWNQDLINLSEQFHLLLLNNGGRVLGIVELFSGGISSTVVDLKMVFGIALKAGASAIIIAHNHPSGNLTPSEADKMITKKLRSAGEMLELNLQDHLIITSEGYFSFSQEGLV